ncbi:TPA: hypothetical protein N0F65_008358 [Lagenidium giganteum]|uniref:PARP-type domain-containing protein n=1 Tax=Lagenidium giganteum TaxID=4803 RepID=A0AAV2YRX1_9STRA|nr:TPA: hypothetical protein N0F65_008358 [Lagenidium giganteum]
MASAQWTRILTYNIYFDAIAMSTRIRVIGKMIKQMRPAVIGFQEVTTESLAMLKAQEWAKFYDCSVDVALPFSSTYFVALFSALPVQSIETFPFTNTQMGRELVCMTVAVDNEAQPNKPPSTLVVGTAHLESLPQNSRARVEQLKQSLRTLQEHVETANAARPGSCLGAVFVGDTNLFRADMKLLDDKFGAAAELLVERAKTSRSKCRKCSLAIAKDSERVGRSAKDRLPNGRTVEIVQWHHRTCFLKSATLIEKQYLAQLAGQDASSTGENDKEDQENKPLDLATLGLPEGWKDLWLTVPGNTEENGFTFDGKRNSLVTQSSYQSRFDRMYFFPGAGLTSRDDVLKQLDMVGTDAITEGIWPSDHFGLLGHFDFFGDSKRGNASEDSSSEKKTTATLGTGSKTEPITID